MLSLIFVELVAITNFTWRKCAIRHRSRLAERWEGKVPLGNNAKSRKLLTSSWEHARTFLRKADEPFPLVYVFLLFARRIKEWCSSWKSFSRQCFRRWFEFVLTFLRPESSISFPWKPRKASTVILPRKFIHLLLGRKTEAFNACQSQASDSILDTKRFDNR